MMPRMLPAIVAHRGDAEHFPENSLPALAAAWRRLEFAEFDVQLSADCVPFVIHDASLDRTTRGAGDLRLMMSGQLDGIDAGEPARFGGAHAGTALPRLSAVAELMADYRRRGLSSRSSAQASCTTAARTASSGCWQRSRRCRSAASSSRSTPTPAGSRARPASCPIGWVLDGDPMQLRPVLELMQPEYVFCDHRKLTAARALPTGRWTWVAYEVTDASLALELAARGVGMVESMAPLRLAGELAARDTARA